MPILGNIIFDMDGTLIDTMDHHAKAFSEILNKKYGIPETFARREYYVTAGSALDDQFQQVLTEYDENQVINIKSLVDAFWNRVSSIPPKLMPSVSYTIPILAEAGYNLFLTSGCRQDVVQYRMFHAELGRYFSLMFGTDLDDMDFKKGPSHFELFRKHLKLSEDKFKIKTMMVGDGIYDMKLGTSVGFISVGLESSASKKQLLESGAHFVISKVEDILRLLRATIKGKLQFRPISDLWIDLKTG